MSDKKKAVDNNTNSDPKEEKKIKAEKPKAVEIDLTSYSVMKKLSFVQKARLEHAAKSKDVSTLTIEKWNKLLKES